MWCTPRSAIALDGGAKLEGFPGFERTCVESLARISISSPLSRTQGTYRYFLGEIDYRKNCPVSLIFPWPRLTSLNIFGDFPGRKRSLMRPRLCRASRTGPRPTLSWRRRTTPYRVAFTSIRARRDTHGWSSSWRSDTPSTSGGT